MEQGDAQIPFQCTISLDCQTLDYFRRLLGNGHGRIPEDTREVFDFLVLENANIHPLPYILENLSRQRTHEEAGLIFERLRAYQILRTVDTVHYRSTRQLRSTLSGNEITAAAQHSISELPYSCQELLEEVKSYQARIYCLLLKAVEIQFQFGNKLTPYKLTNFFDFLHEILATIPLQECLIAKSILSPTNKLRFTRGIQKNSGNILRKINAMAWDLFHVRLLNQIPAMGGLDGARYFFASMLTFDKGLTRGHGIAELKSLAILADRVPKRALPFTPSWLTQMFGDLPDPDFFSQRYSSPAMIASRNDRRTRAYVDVTEVVTQLGSAVTGLLTPTS